jgi:hypothetical protein
LKKDIRFDERVSVVTEAGNVLGRACIPELSRRDALIVVNDYGGSTTPLSEATTQLTWSPTKSSVPEATKSLPTIRCERTPVAGMTGLTASVRHRAVPGYGHNAIAVTTHVRYLSKLAR